MPVRDPGICAAPPCLARALGGLACAAVLLAILALSVGAGPVWPSGGSAWAEWRTSPAAALLWEWRAPRVAMAFLVGACLAMSGLIFQGVFRNPLAEPGVTGVSSGAAVVAVLLIVTGVAQAVPWSLPLGAFAGAFLTVTLVQVIAGARGGPGTLLLIGIALNAFLGAVIAALVVNAPAAEDAQQAMFWLNGDLTAAT